MGIFNNIFRGSVSLEFNDEAKTVMITGVSTKRILRDFSIYAGTKVIEAMILKRSFSSFTFYSFYLPDIHHIVNTLSEVFKTRRNKSPPSPTIPSIVLKGIATSDPPILESIT